MDIDLKNLATKKDLHKTDSKVDKLVIDVVNIKEDIKELASRKDIVNFKDEILSAISEITEYHGKHADEHTANLGAHNRMQGDINEVRGHVGMKIKHPVLDAESAQA